MTANKAKCSESKNRKKKNTLLDLAMRILSVKLKERIFVAPR